MSRINKNMNKLLFFLLITSTCFAQQEPSNNVLRTEFMLGKSIPSYELFTGNNPQVVLGISYEHKNTDDTVEWQSILNHPTTGIGLFYTNYGTKTKGQSLSLIPFVAFHPIKNYKWSTKFGMGISYFDTQYHPINNPDNHGVSTRFTWAIQGFLYYDSNWLKKHDLRLGLGVFHQSNGHTRLPNEGYNSALLSFSSTFDLKKSFVNTEEIFDKSTVKKYGDYFYEMKVGNGFHAFITENSTVKSVYSFEAKGGLFYKNIVKLSVGVNYRLYQHYYDYIVANQLETFIENPKWNASNINISIGAEVLSGKVGIDWEGGLNLYKPFYKTHFDMQKTKSKYKLKKLFLGRLGLKWYAINTKKKSQNNFYIAAHINSNLSQADFSEVSIGFVHRMIKKSNK